MNYRLKRVGVLKLGIVFSALYAVLALVLVPFLAIAMIAGTFAHTQNGNTPMSLATALGGSVVMLVLLPIFYGIIGFIGGVIMAGTYNLIVKFVGGIEFELEA